MRRGRKVNFIRVGENLALGRSEDSYGVWTRQAATERCPGPPARSFPLTDEGWTAAWHQFQVWEPAASSAEADVIGAYESFSEHRAAADRSARELAAAEGGRNGRGPRPPNPLRWWGRGAALITSAAVVVGAGAILALSHRESKLDHLSALGSRSPAPGARPAPRGAPAAPAPRPTPEATPGYLGRAPGWVYFLHWTQHHLRLTGTAEVVSTAGDPPNMHTTTHTLALSGVETASLLTIDLQGRPPAFGTVHRGAFRVEFPNTGGPAVPVRFSPASVAQFRQAVQGLSTDVAIADRLARTAGALGKATG